LPTVFNRDLAIKEAVGGTPTAATTDDFIEIF